jgi:hypothetical protein
VLAETMHRHGRSRLRYSRKGRDFRRELRRVLGVVTPDQPPAAATTRARVLRGVM